MRNYGMDSDYGNRVIDGLVIAAKELGWTFDEIFDYLDDISTVNRLHCARYHKVKSKVYKAVFVEVDNG
jgi:hypothetical protein